MQFGDVDVRAVHHPAEQLLLGLGAGAKEHPKVLGGDPGKLGLTVEVAGVNGEHPGNERLTPKKTFRSNPVATTVLGRARAVTRSR